MRQALSDILFSSTERARELLSILARVARQDYQERFARFTAGLSQFDQEVLSAAQTIPYAEKDWYRDPHDLVVTQCMQTIVRRESLPAWLVTAAILHDRGYGLLASLKNEDAADYLKRKGAHWETHDTRILHSKLSRQYACDLLFAPLAPLMHVGKEIGDAGPFLELIEKHDYPLIGLYDHLPEWGQHHFDADSLFSISLTSFIKDYLSYLCDEGKLKAAFQSGLCPQGRFVPASLLMARLSRFYRSSEELPLEWDVTEFPLFPEAIKFVEGARCISPHSVTAKVLTDEAFGYLAECCTLFETIDDLSKFEVWFKSKLTEQNDNLQKLVDAH